MGAVMPVDLLWQHALAAIPLVLVVALVTRFVPCRPATRHMLWVTALVWLILAPFLPTAPTVTFVATATSQVKTGADSALSTPTAPPVDDRPASTAHPMTLDDRIAEADEPDVPFDDVERSTEPSGTARADFASKTFFDVLPSSPSSSPEEHNKEHRSPSSQWSVARLRPQGGPQTPKRLAQATGSGGPLTHNTAQCPRRDLRLFDLPAATAVPVGQTVTEAALPLAGVVDEVLSEDPMEQVTASTPTVAATVAPSQTPTATRAWVIGLTAIAGAIANLPSFPPTLWIGGAVLIVLLGALRVIRSRTVIRAARPAPIPVTDLVAEVAQSIGLRRVPETFIVDRRTSPMIWCGRKLRLVLPSSLWVELDDIGRRAVVVHELAHLRRRDHWVSWVGLLVGILYWWYPLVWWVRSRVNAEAEHCCDAWVTTLLPRSRRAYAEALLKAKQHVFESDRVVPAVGIGITTGQAGRFARRLSMVMTQNVKPRLSPPGMALVASVALAGWLAAPVSSCPPDKKHDTHHAAQVTVSEAPCADVGVSALISATHPGGEHSKHWGHGDVVVTGVGSGWAKAKAPCDKGCSGCTSKHGKKTSAHDGCKCSKKKKHGIRGATVSSGEGCGKHEGHGKGHDDDDAGAHGFGSKGYNPMGKLFEGKHSALPSALGYAFAYPQTKSWGDYRFAGYDDDEDLDKRLKLMEQRLEKLGKHIAKIADALEDHGDSPAARRGARTPTPRAPRMAREPRAPRAPREPRTPRAPRAPLPPTAPGPSLVFETDSDDGETIIRAYRIPDGKREALTELMVRSDVPVLVRPMDDGIEVHGTASQQRAFAAFVKIICPSKDGRSDATVPNLEFFPEAKVRQRLAQGLAARAAGRAEAHAHAASAAKARAHYEHAVQQQQKAKGKAKSAAKSYKLAQRIHEMRAKQAALEHEAEALEDQAEALRENAEDIHERADDLREEAEDLRENANDLREEASAAEDSDDQKKLQKKAQALLKQAKKLAAEAKKLDRHAGQLSKKAEKVQQKAQSAERKADKAQQHMEEIDE